MIHLPRQKGRPPKRRTQFLSKPKDTHRKAVWEIAKIVNRSPEYVNIVVTAFFGENGIRYFIKLGRNITIRNFGHFYFDKRSLKKLQSIEDHRKEARRIKIRNRVRRFRERQKQKKL